MDGALRAGRPPGRVERSTRRSPSTPALNANSMASRSGHVDRSTRTGKFKHKLERSPRRPHPPLQQREVLWVVSHVWALQKHDFEGRHLPCLDVLGQHDLQAGEMCY